MTSPYTPLHPLSSPYIPLHPLTSPYIPYIPLHPLTSPFILHVSQIEYAQQVQTSRLVRLNILTGEAGFKQVMLGWVDRSKANHG